MTQVDPGYITACVVASFLLTCCIGFVGHGIWLYVVKVRPHGQRATVKFEGLGQAAVGLVLTALVAGGFTAATWPPFEAEYHTWRQVAGTVHTVDLVHTQVVLTLADNPHVYQCSDVRCAVAKRGDRLTLWCLPEHQPVSPPSHRCTFVDNQPATARIGPAR